MGIFLKALIKSLKDKKARTALVLFSIAVSASLIFANENFSQVCEKRFYAADVRHAGNSDIRINTKEAVGSKEWIDLQKLSKYKSKVKYQYQFIQEKALYEPSIKKMHYFNLIGTDIREFNDYNPISLSSGNFKNWKGYKAIIGTTYAEKYHLKLNDSMKLELKGRKYGFKIVGISKPKGLFTRELADGGYILVPRDTITRIYNGGTNLIYMKLKDHSQQKAMKDKLTKELKDYEVYYGVDEALIAAETNNYVMPFRISAIAVIFMSMFIIFAAFNLITLERIPLIGTLRSIGCSRKRINRVLIAESACLGAVGGLLGCLIGTGVLQLIVKLYFANDASELTPGLSLGSRATPSAIAVAIIITTASAIIPILRITKIPIKNIILNDLKKKYTKKSKLWIIGLLLMSSCVIVPHYMEVNLTGMIVTCITLTFALIGMIPLVPFLTWHLSNLLGKVPFISQDIVLGIRNVRDNKGLVNNIQLFAAAIAIVAFMTSLFNSMYHDMIIAFQRDTKYNIELVLRHSDKTTLSKVSRIKGVKECLGNYKIDADLPEHNTFFNMLYGIENRDFFKYNKVRQLNTNKKALSTLNDGRNIITTNILKDKLNLALGDKLAIKFGSKTVKYRITGFVETNLGIGHVGYISAGNLKRDKGISDYTEIYVRTKENPKAVKNNILKALNKEIMSINTKAELLTANADKVVPMFNAISVYSYIALLIGLIGIINNLVASFLERKRGFAMLRSIGMSGKSLRRMLITEAVMMGLYGVVFGLVSAVIMSSAIPSLVSLFWGKVTVALAVKQMVVMGISGILAMLAISALPAIKGNKLSIIESIKYE